MNDFPKIALAATYGVTLERSALGSGAMSRFAPLVPRAGLSRVLIVNSNPTMRAGLRAALGQAPELVIVGEASSACAALVACRQLDVGVAVLDSALDDLDVFEAVLALRGHKPGLPILVLYVALTGFDVSQLLHIGVTGLVRRDADVEELVQAVRTLVRGGSYLPATFTAKLFRHAPTGPGTGLGGLSAREVQVLRYVASGFSNKDVARRLGLSVRTVETHRLNLRRKTGVSRPKDLVQLAKRLKLLGSEEPDDGHAPLALASP